MVTNVRIACDFTVMIWFCFHLICEASKSDCVFVCVLDQEALSLGGD